MRMKKAFELAEHISRRLVLKKDDLLVVRILKQKRKWLVQAELKGKAYDWDNKRLVDIMFKFVYK